MAEACTETTHEELRQAVDDLTVKVKRLNVTVRVVADIVNPDIMRRLDELPDREEDGDA